jgi:excisionase family DNA binding protein
MPSSNEFETPVLKPAYLRTNEAALVFGVSTEALRRLAKDGKLTAFKPLKGRGLRFSFAELEALFEASAVK